MSFLWTSYQLASRSSATRICYADDRQVYYLLLVPLILGAVKAGYKVRKRTIQLEHIVDFLFRFSFYHYEIVGAQLELIRATQCKTFTNSDRLLPFVAAILAAADNSLKTLEILTIEKLLITRTKHYPYEKKFDEVCDGPLVVMHTSGSTGFPKPISWTHGFCKPGNQIAAFLQSGRNEREVQRVGDRESSGTERKTS
ncbi:hypothetical protein NHQ30_002664 [Ciborinia camelliae]|nr:hypothetical protein NHQ30_002664 [Ciborinia camelliae]